MALRVWTPGEDGVNRVPRRKQVAIAPVGRVTLRSDHSGMPKHFSCASPAGKAGEKVVKPIDRLVPVR